MLQVRTAGALGLALAAIAAPALHAQSMPATLDTVRVASRVAAIGSPARSVDVLDRATLARSSGRTLGELLMTRLGVDLLTRSPAQADLQLRGASFNQVLVLVDGVRVSDAQTGHHSLNLAIPLDEIERVEILRGGGSTLYGSDAMGGVVNIVTRRTVAGDGAEYAARAAGGSFGTAMLGASAGATLGGLALRLSASHDRADGGRPGTDYRITQASVTATRGAFDVSAGLGVRHFGAADFYGAFPSFESTRSANAMLRWQVDAPGAWRIATTLHARRHSDIFTLRRTNPAAYQNRHFSWQRGGEVVARRAHAGGGVAVGAEALDFALESNNLGDRGQRRAAGFAELSQRIGLLRVDGGARVDWSNEFDAFVSPSLALLLPAGDRTQLRAAVDRGFRAPNWTERFYRDPANIADPSVRPESFWSGEVGARVLPRWGYVDVAGFVRVADDLIDWARPAGSPATTPWRTTNVQQATYRGIELEVRLPQVAGVGTTFRASGLDFDAEEATGLQGKYALRPLTRTFGADVDVPLPGAVQASVQLLHGRRAGERGYERADVRVSRAWRALRWHLDVRNLTDANYPDASVRPVEGRALFLGVSWSDGR